MYHFYCLHYAKSVQRTKKKRRINCLAQYTVIHITHKQIGKKGAMCIVCSSRKINK